MLRKCEDFIADQLTGRNRRLWYEWCQIDKRLASNPVIHYEVVRENADGLPTAYLITYQLRSICGVEQIERLNEPGVDNAPIFSIGYRMRLDLPLNYPCVDAAPSLYFLTTDNLGTPIPHPWHPNIRYFGDFAGLVCLNTNACGSYTDLSFYINRVVSYLKFEKYHALNTPPYPQDNKVAEWVLEQAEPNGWITELQEYHNVQNE